VGQHEALYAPSGHASGNSHERDSLSAQRRCDVAAGEESQQQQEQAAQLQTAQLQLSRAQTRRRRTAGLAKSFAASCARRTASASSAPRCVFGLRARLMPCPLMPSLSQLSGKQIARFLASYSTLQRAHMETLKRASKKGKSGAAGGGAVGGGGAGGPPPAAGKKKAGRTAA